MKKNRGKKPKKNKQTPAVPTQVAKSIELTQPKSRLQSIRSNPTLKVIWVIIGAIGVIGSALAAISRILGGPPWPVEPEIHFRDTNDGSSLRLPFEIANRSGFTMPRVSFRCGVQFYRAVDASGNEVGGGDVVFTNGTKSISTTATFDCDAADLLRIRPDGSLAYRNSSTVLEARRRIIYKAPWRIVKMCVWVEGSYNFAGVWPVAFISHMFQWPAKPGSHQWREGPFVGERPPEEIEEEKRLGLVPGILACPDERLFPYALVEEAGMARLVFDPKQMIAPLGEPPWP